MNQQDFFRVIEQYGIDLNKLSITIGEVSGWEGAHGIYQKDGKWFYYSADGRNHIDSSLLDSEEEAFSKMLRCVFLDLDTKRYLTKAIDEDVVKIEKGTVCHFMCDAYSITQQQASDAWDYLKQDMRVLFEFKHYVATGEFVPEKYSYKVQGYSAERLHKTTYLEVLGAFNYLIYLRNKPKEALLNLQKGLPRRKVFSEAELKAVQKKV